MVITRPPTFLLKRVKVYNIAMHKRVFQPHSVDRTQVHLLLNLPPHKRIRLMLDARELAVGLIRGRLRKQYPQLPLHLLNLKVLDEIDA